MKLDLVHDLQEAYRKTLDSMSRPGLISNIQDQASKVALEISKFNPPAPLVMVLMLFDTEVKFKVCSKREAEIAELINQLTYAKATEIENADFILVLNDADPEEFEQVINSACPGDLHDPHKAATIIIEADSVSNDRDLTLIGPGIEIESFISVRTSHNWVDLRADKNSEYPLGIDLIFTDRNANILCLPRTTQIWQEVAG
ncbi:phosphonate C-P lyase system protein PhnH [Desulfosporosinus nitroreducens]|uniref:Phosphonate C-P lyase system protein PhnH n=1 Tax=Desulfosporosinus nitroreducens TaxID=2018668 RepID=A0ABT8QV40_9FIRM|nr:phosphonate C-P lyase system protein PhnH [Desulfosporosinus nitroreducens]MDO0825221.1 phosphonate C-P lyase system protein PhnH [Desulfosporosinus nitroreducens]